MKPIFDKLTEQRSAFASRLIMAEVIAKRGEGPLHNPRTNRSIQKRSLGSDALHAKSIPGSASSPRTASTTRKPKSTGNG